MIYANQLNQNVGVGVNVYAVLTGMCKRTMMSHVIFHPNLVLASKPKFGNFTIHYPIHQETKKNRILLILHRSQ